LAKQLQFKTTQQAYTFRLALKQLEHIFEKFLGCVSGKYSHRCAPCRSFPSKEVKLPTGENNRGTPIKMALLR